MADIDRLTLNGIGYNFIDTALRDNVRNLRDNVRNLRDKVRNEARETELISYNMLLPGSKKEPNIIDLKSVLVGYDLRLSDGQPYTNSTTHRVTGYIPMLNTGDTIYFTDGGLPTSRNSYKFMYLCRYDSSFNYLGYVALATESDEQISYDVQEGDCWIRFSYTAGVTPKVEYSEITPLYLSNPQFAKNDSPLMKTKTILKRDGIIYFNDNYSVTLYVSDFIDLAPIAGSIVKNAMSWTAATAYPIAFYDITKTPIGNAYTPTVDTDKTSVDIKITKDLLMSYPGAVYCRIGGDSLFGTEIVTEKEIELQNEIDEINQAYPPYNVNIFNKVVFCGDSVTEGFVVDGSIYEVESIYSYPTEFGKIFPKLEVVNKGASGISPYGFYTNMYPSIDYSEFDLIVFELGYNGHDKGYLKYSDLNTEGTNTYIYRQMISGVRAQNTSATIILVNSSYSANSSTDSDTDWNWVPILTFIAEESDCLVLNLKDKRYLNLNNIKYHGLHDGTMDYVHFNRRGYNAKAYVFTRLLGEILPD